MKVYESVGTFDDVKKEFNLAVQLTDIVPDRFQITAWYDISNSNRYAIVGILQTSEGNANDLSDYPANFTFAIDNSKFSGLDQNYKKTGDLDINNAKKGDTIDVVVHHGIGFDPKTNADDNLHIENYKAGLSFQGNGAPPKRGGKGILT